MKTLKQVTYHYDIMVTYIISMLVVTILTGLRNLDHQRGAIIATELKTNSCKTVKWTNDK